MKLREKHGPWRVRDVLAGTAFETHAKMFGLGLFVVKNAFDENTATKWASDLKATLEGESQAERCSAIAQSILASCSNTHK